MKYLEIYLSAALLFVRIENLHTIFLKPLKDYIF